MASVPDADTITYAKVNADVASAAATGTVTSKKVTILRPASYNIVARYGSGQVVANAVRVIAGVANNGTSLVSGEQSALNGAFPTQIIAKTSALVAGDLLTVLAFQNSGSAVNTASSTANTRPTLDVAEIPTW